MIDPCKPALKRGRITFIQGDKVFLCEGRDECEVLALLTHDWQTKPKIGINGDAERGLDQELKALAAQVPLRKIVAIGLIFDAESSRSKTEENLAKWYKFAGLTKPATANRLKISIVDGVKIRTAYLINPPGRSTGCLETLFLRQVSQSKVGKCIGTLMKCYEDNCPTKVKLEKVVMRSFIAHRNGYNTGLGLAVRDGHLNCDGPEFDGLKRFVSKLKSV